MQPCALIAASVIAGVTLGTPALADHLDPTFGTGGRIRGSDVPAMGKARAGLMQPDGKIVAAGRTPGGPALPGFALARFDAGGTLDASFGVGGVTTTPLGDAFTDGAAGLVLQADGKLVAAGSLCNELFGPNDCDVVVARYESSGALDPAFGTGGIVTTDLGGDPNGGATGVALQADGKIVVVAIDGGEALLRYDASGILDPSFGTGGIVTPPAGAGAAVLVQPDGKIVVAGGDGDFVLARFHTTGALDAGFGTGGVVTTDLGGMDEIAAITLAPDGSIVAAGESGEVLIAGVVGIGNSRRIALARYDASGSLDASFGAGGTVIRPVGAEEAYLKTVLLEPGGRIVAAGHAEGLSAVGGGDEVFLVARFESDGSVDDTLHPCVQLVTRFEDERAIVFTLVQQADGKIVAIGGSSSVGGFAAARYTTTATPACTGAAKGLLRLRNQLGGTVVSDSLKWKAVIDAPLDPSTFGAPLTASDVTLCVVDELAGEPRLALHMTAEGGEDCETGPCWAPKGSAGFRFKRRDSSTKEVTKVLLLGGAKRGKLKWIERRGRLGMARTLPTSVPAAARLVRSDAPACWEATFAAPTTNTFDQFSAKAP